MNYLLAELVNNVFIIMTNLKQMEEKGITTKYTQQQIGCLAFLRREIVDN